MKASRVRCIGLLLLGCGPGAAAERPAPVPPATAIVGVETAVRPDAVTVTLRGNGVLVPGRIREVEHFRPRLVMDFPGLAAEAAAAVPVDADPVDRVRVDRASVELTRVVFELARPARYHFEAADPAAQGLRVVFPHGAGASAAIEGAGNAPGVFPHGAGARGAGIEEAPPGGGSARAGAGGAAPSVAAGLPGQPAESGAAYSGDPVSMDFQNADLRSVLRVFAEISALNLVIDPSVQGEVNVALTQVPWDQAFDVILRASGLGYERDGPVVRIASLERLQQEAEARAVLAQREAEAGELVVFARTLSYARADDLVPLLTGAFLSPRGDVFTDGRTNTLIIRDLAGRLRELDDLLDTLDRVEPQVEIEARIVRAGHDSARALGVQWGLGGDRGGSPEPPEAGAGGTRGRLDESLSTGVDLGVGAPTSSLGLALRTDDGSLGLDVVLSALESQGELQIISSPRITTQNNVPAEILQGDQIPYQTVANNTVTVQFKEAALTLRVTPRITAADTVVMQVEVENSFADFARALGSPPIPAIVTQRAATTVQVGDGETAVIGGIHENTRSARNSRTPGLHRIPLLGWLFRSSTRNQSTDELMIFLTPRIVR